MQFPRAQATRTPGRPVAGIIWAGLCALIAWALSGRVATPAAGLATAIGLLTLFVAAIVATFSLRYMRADRQSSRFFVRLGLLVTSVLGFLFTDNLIALGAAWFASGWLLAGLIGHADGWYEASAAAARARRAFLIGDVVLLAALGILGWQSGSMQVGVILPEVSQLPFFAINAAALLLVVAAAARCAVPPFSGWLLSSMTAPTPVSALMHAGLVNAGGFLLIRFAPVLEAAPVARAVAMLLGLFGAIYGVGIMMVRPDIKRSLAGSTVSQMGFMILSCGLGAYAAALWHLIAHGLFKAWLFLGSGSAIGMKAGKRGLELSGRANLLIAVTTLIVALFIVSISKGNASLVPLLLGFATASATLVAWLGGKVPMRARLTLLLALIVLIAFHSGGLALAGMAVGRDAALIAPDWAMLVLLVVFLGAWTLQQHSVAAQRPVPLPLYVQLLNAGRLLAAPPGEQKMNMISRIVAIDPILTRTEVAGLVALSGRTVPPIWPLESAIAVNPLAGFEDLPYDEAVRLAARRFGARESLPLSQWRKLLAAGKIGERELRDAAIGPLGGLNAAFELIGPDISRLDLLMARLLDLPASDREDGRSEPGPAAGFIAKWCAAFFDQGQASSPMPNRELGLYRATLAAIAYDPEFRALTGTTGQQLLLSVPRDPLEAIAEGLVALGIDHGDEETRLAELVARLPGWAGHIRWRNENADPEMSAGAPAGMADLLALWLLLERSGAAPLATGADETPSASSSLAVHFGLADVTVAGLGLHGHARFAKVASISEGTLGLIFQTAAEWTYRNTLAPKLQSAAVSLSQIKTPDAQLVFCIDVRSEPFRRALEAEGRFETYGYAGFFGLPIALHRLGDDRRTRLLPVLLSPQHDVSEAPIPGREQAAAALAAGQRRSRQASALFDAGKGGTATAFATAEATGPLAGLLMAARTLAPSLVKRIGSRFAPSRHEAFAPSLEHDGDHGCTATFTREEKLGFALALFKLTGLPAQTARIVALVGHGGSAVNNPYAAALDCGACGGHAGGPNARILAAILNDPEVREDLAACDFALPETTCFLAAEHNTTTDEVVIFDRSGVPESHSDDLEHLDESLAKAGAANRQRRAAPLGRTAADLMVGAMHWGEVRPEWGLAGNAAFIVGPRALTRQIDLEGRAFLHSYDWQTDADGTALTTILTAPMVVAQWINCQYLFSTIDNDRYGSGDKVTQNVVGGIGVLQGNGGDLRVGLPRQSLFMNDGTPFHVPQRLMTVVLSPFEPVERVVESNDILGRLFGNGWVTLVVIDPRTGKAMRWRRDLELTADANAAPLNQKSEF